MMGVNLRVLYIVLMIFSAGYVHADVKSKAMIEANKLAAGMVNKDYKTVAELTHPAMVKGFGGVDALTAAIEKNFTDASINLTRMKFRKPNKLNTSGKLLLAKLLYDSNMRVAKESYDISSFYVGFSTDKKKWYFVDCEGLTQDLLKKLAPGYDGKLNLGGC